MKLRFYVFIFFYFFLILLDAGYTFIGTPDLELEANPLVARLGLGWKALIAVNVLAYVLYVIAVRYTFIVYSPPEIRETRFTRYASELFFGRPDKFTWVIFRVPTNWKPVWACLGYACAWAMPFSRLFTVAEWLMHLLGIDAERYYRLRELMPFDRLDAVVAVVIALVMSAVWIYEQHRRNRRQLTASA